mgnify:CR=1 FL=1|tara:strand:- start:181842 stop:182897 length:1056 start_codon:yes stop_codon:yes gene_type:complete
MNKHSFLYILCTFLLVSCGRVETIGLKKHQFNKRPRRIVWIQVAGLSSEHLAMLRFKLADARQVTPLEKAECVGQTWSFNLLSLRPSVNQSFNSQVFGAGNLKNRCDSLSHTPIWKLYSEANYSIAAIENLTKKSESLTQLKECKEKKKDKDGKEEDVLKNLNLFVMGKKKNKESKSFHYQEEIALSPDVYYDKACSSGNCISSLPVNSKKIWEKMVDSSNRSFLLIRDFKYLAALKRRDFESAKENLLQLAKLYEYFIDSSAKNKDTLVLLSTSNALNFEFPKEGSKWAEFERTGRNVLYRNTSLISQTYAFGPSSENFCGVYNENEIFTRLIWESEERSLSIESLKELF